MNRTKSATLLVTTIAGMLSLAATTSVLAQRGGHRDASEQDNKPVATEDDSREKKKHRGEQARTEPARAAQVVRESNAQQNPQRFQEAQSENNRRDVRTNNPRTDDTRQQNERERDGIRLRQQQEQENQQSRQVAERDAAAQRIALQRGNADRARTGRDNQNERTDSQSLAFRDSRRPDDRNNRNNHNDQNDNNRDNRNDNRDNRDNRNDNNRSRPDQERQHRQSQEQQQRQANDYRRHQDNQSSDSRRLYERLRQQNRNEQYRSQQRYYDRLSQQRRNYGNNRYSFNINYYNSPIIYRYSRGGSYYYANRYQADLMHQAINYGYEEGLYAGRADRSDRWGYNYRDAFAYQDANYGYYGYYVDQGTYNYYFREGFRRGYDDGYYSRYQYGRRYGNGYSTNDSILRLILNLSNWHH
ncbi:MAG: hypothetical protein ABI644_02805 [Arenimonas sp.]